MSRRGQPNMTLRYTIHNENMITSMLLYSLPSA